MVVRPEARASLLAYAYLRGKSLHAIERCPTVRPPNWVNVKRIAKKFSIVPFNEAHFDAWTEIDMSLKKVA